MCVCVWGGGGGGVGGRGVTNDVMFSYVHEKINVLLSVLSIFLAFLLFQREYTRFCILKRNMQVLAKCNVCISVIQLVYIQTSPGFLPISK